MTDAPINGRAWKYGDNIDTDQLAPIGSYKGTTDADLAQGAVHCLRDLDPDFAANVADGEVFVAGNNLGIGSSREAAPFFLKTLGIRAVLAKSFARIFFRNCFNIGLPALICAETHRITSGDELTVDPIRGTVENRTTGETYECEPVPPHLMEMVASGGLMRHLEKRFKGGA
ncbi:MAG: 3-isopropylmalate dehydratase small subunit [Proteobacteria bacterium]|nr:3-isopropylmalate dehydratase small subunit [Pseudomonadota bacterium]